MLFLCEKGLKHMGIFDEFKRLARPYEDEDDYDDFEFSPHPAECQRRVLRSDYTDRTLRGDYNRGCSATLQKGF